MIPRPPRSPLFPYTPLFRSWEALANYLPTFSPEDQRVAVTLYRELAKGQPVDAAQLGRALGVASTGWPLRSEEHTSELQSRLHLVCRLLLEKKKDRPLTIRARAKPHQRAPVEVHVGHPCVRSFRLR